MILYGMITAAALAAAWYLDKARTAIEYVPGKKRGGRLYRAEALGSLCLAFLFVILAVPVILRLNVGNDYMRYVAFMHLANVHAYVPTEAGFNWLVRLIYGLCGYENYLLVFAVFTVFTVLFFLAGIMQQAQRPFFSFFLFMMLGYYFRSYNTVRYYLALSLALFAMGLLLKGKTAGFLLCVLIGSLFHKSMLVVLILYPLCRMKWNKKAAAAVFAAAGVLSRLRPFWMKAVVRLYPSYEGTSFLAGGKPSYINIALCAAVLFLWLLVRYFESRPDAVLGIVHAADEDEKIFRSRQYTAYTQMNITALFLYCFFSYIPELSRIGYYLTVSQIFLIPMLLLRLPERWKGIPVRHVMTGAVSVCAALYFAGFMMTASRPDIRILPYRTFLFNDLPIVIRE